jgi:hypothetical protein
MRRAQRTVATFGVVCLVSAAVGGFRTHDVATTRLAIIAGGAMIVWSIWSRWREG